MTTTPQTTQLIICDAYYRNLAWPADGPYLKRCQHPAQFTLTLRDGNEVYTVQRCRICRDQLTAEAANGATFEILDETQEVDLWPR